MNRIFIVHCEKIKILIAKPRIITWIKHKDTVNRVVV